MQIPHFFGFSTLTLPRPPSLNKKKKKILDIITSRWRKDQEMCEYKKNPPQES